MSFQTVTFRWNGEDFSIPPNRIMRAIAIIEETVTLSELYQYSQKGSAPLSKLSSAFAGVLRYAGAQCTDEQVYMAMFSETEAGSAMQSAIQTLLMMMVPIEIKPETKEAPAPGNVPTPDKPMSKKRTKQRSDSGG